MNSNQVSSTERLLNTIRQREPAESLPEPYHAPDLKTRIKNRFSINKPKDYIGVELFRDSLNLVRMSYTRAVWHAAQAISIPLQGDTNLENPEFSQFLKKQLQNISGDNQEEIWLCLPAAKGEIWNVLVPKIRKGLDNAVYWAARKERTFDPKEYVFDYRIQGEFTDQETRKLRAEVCIASTQDVEFYQQLFRNIGYPLHGITLPTLALENIFFNNWIPPRNDTFAVLYIAPDCSYITLQDQEGSLLNRIIKTGQDSILDEFRSQETLQGHLDIEADQSSSLQEEPSQESATSREKIEQILENLQDKGKQDTSRSGYTSEEVMDMIRPALQRLARQLERTMDHSVNVLNNPAPECIYISGRIAGLPGIPDFFQEQLGMDAVLLDVLHPDLPQVSPELSALEKHQRLVLASTAGLAIPSSKSINFLHTAKDRSRARAAQQKANSVAVACALLFVLAFGYWWYSNQELQQLHSDVASLEQELQQYEPLITQDKIREMAQTIQEEQEEMLRVSRNLFPAAVIQEVNQITPGHIELLSLDMDFRTSEENNSNQNSNQEHENILILQGLINSATIQFETHLVSYLWNLQNSPLINEVQIKNNFRESMPGTKEVYKFTLNIVLEKV